MQIKLSSHSILTPGQPNVVLTLSWPGEADLPVFYGRERRVYRYFMAGRGGFTGISWPGEAGLPVWLGWEIFTGKT